MADLAENIKTEILNAFAATPYPGDDNLVIDQTGRDPECMEIATAFKGKQWNDVPSEMLREYAEALPLFTPGAFRYYLPAYVVGCIQSGYGVDVVKDFVPFNLTPPDRQNGWEADFFRARAEQFNGMEREAIKSFLEMMEQYRLADWASEGLKPPEDRIRAAVDFWASAQ